MSGLNRSARAVVMGLMAVAVVAAAPGHQVDEKFGKGVSLTETTPSRRMVLPTNFSGKTIRLDGVVTAVCEQMGCWMALGETDKADNTVRLKVDHDSGIAFPISAKGKAASAEGVFEKISDSDKEAREAASEQAAGTKASDFGRKYQLKATGAIVR